MSSGRAYVLSIATGGRKTDKDVKKGGQEKSACPGTCTFMVSTEGFQQEIGGRRERVKDRTSFRLPDCSVTPELNQYDTTAFKA